MKTEKKEDSEIENFINYLAIKGLSQQTLELYALYYSKLEMIREELGDDFEMTQDLVNAFILKYNHAVCRAFFKNYLKFKGIKDLDIPLITGRKKKRETSTIPPEHLERIKEQLYLDDYKYGLMFELTYMMALRREEVINIKVEDFNFIEKANDQTLPFTLSIIGKGNRERKVVIPESQEYLIKKVFEYILNNNFQPNDRLFFMHKRTWWKHFNNACVKLGYFKENKKGEKIYLYHPHSIRHSKATEWYEKGVDIVGIQNRLGHTDISTTRIYINPDNKKEIEKWSQE